MYAQAKSWSCTRSYTRLLRYCPSRCQFAWHPSSSPPCTAPFSHQGGQAAVLFPVELLTAPVAVPVLPCGCACYGCQAGFPASGQGDTEEEEQEFSPDSHGAPHKGNAFAFDYGSTDQHKPHQYQQQHESAAGSQHRPPPLLPLAGVGGVQQEAAGPAAFQPPYENIPKRLSGHLPNSQRMHQVGAWHVAGAAACIPSCMWARACGMHVSGCLMGYTVSYWHCKLLVALVHACACVLIPCAPTHVCSRLPMSACCTVCLMAADHCTDGHFCAQQWQPGGGAAACQARRQPQFCLPHTRGQAVPVLQVRSSAGHSGLFSPSTSCSQMQSSRTLIELVLCVQSVCLVCSGMQVAG